jgi:hypothetical protein
MSTTSKWCLPITIYDQSCVCTSRLSMHATYPSSRQYINQSSRLWRLKMKHTSKLDCALMFVRIDSQGHLLQAVQCGGNDYSVKSN